MGDGDRGARSEGGSGSGTASDEIWRPDYRGPDPVRRPIRSMVARLPVPDAVVGGGRGPGGRAAGAGTTSGSSAGAAAPAAIGSPGGGTPGGAVGPVVAASAPPPTTGPEATGTATGTGTGGAPGGRSYRTLGVASVAVALVAAAAVIAVVGGAGSPTGRAARPTAAALVGASTGPGLFDPPEPGRVAGAERRRLPRSLDLRWARALDAPRSAGAWVESSDGSIVVAHGGTAGPTTIVAFEPDTGRARWTRRLDADLASVEHLASDTTTMVLDVDGEMTGIDLATGERAWSLLPDPGVRSSDIVALAGTSFLAIPAGAGASVVVTVATGVVVGWLDGERVGTDGSGTWFVRRGDEVLAYDLARGWSGPTVIATGVVDPVVGVVGATVVSSGPRGWSSTGGSTEVPPRPVPLAPGVGEPPPADGIVPLVGRAFLAGSGDVVRGATLDGSSIVTGWSRDGVVVDTYPTVIGPVALVSSRGGATQTVVDGRTGQAIDVLTLAPGVFDALDVVGDGIVTQRTSPDGPRRAALDLGGREMWAVSDAVDLAVGVGEVATVARTVDGLTVSRFTEP